MIPTGSGKIVSIEVLVLYSSGDALLAENYGIMFPMEHLASSRYSDI